MWYGSEIKDLMSKYKMHRVIQKTSNKTWELVTISGLSQK